MAKITIPYGEKGSLKFNVPDGNFLEILSPNAVQIPADTKGLIEKAVDNPVGSLPLGKIITDRKITTDSKICIICDDVTRHTPAAVIIPIVLDRLNSAGVKDEQIFIVMALGTHRPMTEKEIIHKVGQKVFERIKVYNSEFKDKEDGLVNMGVADDGVPIWLDKRVSQARIKIAVGSIVPHPAAGCGGGAKIIFPGVTGEDTVASFHLQYAATKENMFGAPTTPSRNKMECWVELIGLDFIVNVINLPDGRIYKAVAGHFVKAHRAGVEMMREVYGIKARQKVEIAVASSYPAEIDFWQATKAVFAPDLLTKPGGTIILTTECCEGIGPHPEYADYIGDSDPDRLLKDAYGGKTVDPIAVSGGVTLGRMAKRKKFILVSSGVSKQYAQRMNMEYFADIQQAVDSAIKSHGPHSKVSVLTHAGCSYPFFE